MKFSLVHMVLLAMAVALAGCGTSDTFTPSPPTGGGDGLSWWSGEERSPAGAGPFVPSGGPVPVLLGATTWLGAVEIAGVGVVRALPDDMDPNRSEVLCSTISSTLIDCLSTEYDNGAVELTRDVRAMPGATPPAGTWSANDDWFPGGMASSGAYGKYSDGLGHEVEVVAYVRVGDGLEQRSLRFVIPDVTAGATYTVPGNLSADGARFSFPLAGPSTAVLEFASGGTLTITVANTTLGSTVAGNYDLTFPSGTAIGSFNVTIRDVD